MYPKVRFARRARERARDSLARVLLYTPNTNGHSFWCAGMRDAHRERGMASTRVQGDVAGLSVRAPSHHTRY